VAEPGSGRRRSNKPRAASASGRSVEIAVARALAELDYAPGELTEDLYEVTVLTHPEEGFLGVGGEDALVEVRLLFDGASDVGGGGRVEDDLDGHDEDDLEDDLDEGPQGNVWGPGEAEDDDEGLEDEDYAEAEPPAAGSARLREFLGVVLGALGVEGTIRIVEEIDVLKAEISGDDLGVFIGRRGQTIDSVEYLASLVLYPRPESRKRVELDAAGYKERRRQNIERVALRKAQEAARRGRSVELEPMTAAERKIVHLVLKERRDVTTESRGREPNRAVVILPVR
jgi:spoIIIJ-associated protein